MDRPTPLALAALPAAAFHTAMRVMVAHCDVAGIVFTPRFVEMAHAAIELFVPAALGVDYYTTMRERRIGPGYGHVAFDFFTPAFIGDELRFTVLVERIGQGSVTLHVHGHRGVTPVLRAEMVIVTTDLDRHRAVPLPDWLRAPLLSYQKACA